MLLKQYFNDRLNENILHSFLVFLGFLTFYLAFFSPALLFDRLLAPFDGITYFLPAFYSSKTLWTDLIFGGYPIAADPQNMTWYPPALLLNLIPNSWNLFIVLAYVFAGSFAYCYVYILTSSKLAGVMTGLVYSMSGFMIGHLSQAAMIHAAAWFPLIICSLEKLRHQFERKWVAIGILAVVCCSLGGHPQISLYSIGASLIYALVLGWFAPISRWRYYGCTAGIIFVGLLLCSIQLLPTVELSSLSLRAKLSKEAFLFGSIYPWQVLQFIFPFLFGSGMARDPYTLNSWGGDTSVTEIAGYAGLLPLMFAAVASFDSIRKKRDYSIDKNDLLVTRFWLWIGIIALILMLGRQSFLAPLLYYVPGYNQFRVPARHVLELDFALSVLAGFGVSLIQKRVISKKMLLLTSLASAGMVMMSLLVFFVWHQYFRKYPSYLTIVDISFLPWRNPAIFVPLVVLLLGIFVFLAYSQQPKLTFVKLILLAAIILDLSSFAFWFYDWPTWAPQISKLNPSPTVINYRGLLESSHQRFMNDKGIYVDYPKASSYLFPNFTRLLRFPNASGYSPLILTRIHEMLGIQFTGDLLSRPINQDDRGLDLMSVKYLLSSPDATDQKGIVWGKNNLGISLGSGACASPAKPSSVKLDVSEFPQVVAEIGLVTTMACSVTIPNLAEVLQVQVTDNQGKVETHSLKAGLDTAEQAYDCPDVKPVMRHQRATVFESVPVSRPGVGNCQSNSYVSFLKLSRPQSVSQISLQWKSFPGVISISNISLINREKNTSFPLTDMELSQKWKPVEQIQVGTMYENQQVLPRTWLVSESMQLQPQEILSAIHTSRLPDGQRYEPEKLALVERGSAVFKSSPLQSGDSARVLEHAEDSISIQTKTSSPAFLVLSDVFYPGWEATIDGKPTKIYQTNYVQRGVKVPAGEHVVRFEFHPMSFKLGVGITLASLFGGIYWIFRMKPTKLMPD